MNHFIKSVHSLAWPGLGLGLGPWPAASGQWSDACVGPIEPHRPASVRCARGLCSILHVERLAARGLSASRRKNRRRARWKTAQRASPLRLPSIYPGLSLPPNTCNLVPDQKRSWSFHLPLPGSFPWPPNTLARTVRVVHPADRPAPGAAMCAGARAGLRSNKAHHVRSNTAREFFPPPHFLALSQDAEHVRAHCACGLPNRPTPVATMCAGIRGGLHSDNGLLLSWMSAGHTLVEPAKALVLPVMRR